MNRRLVFPAVMGTWIVVAGATLAGIIMLGPYTHANMAAHPDPSYVRTQQSVVGQIALFQGPGLAGLVPAADHIARGRALMMADQCASCHGLDGRGGVIGKPIVGFTAKELGTKVSKGPGNMPAFDREKLPDADLADIAAYLTSLKQSGS